MTEMSNEEIQEKMKNLVEPVTKAIEKCTSIEELMMLASIMITTSAEILKNALGKEGANELIQGLVEKDDE